MTANHRDDLAFAAAKSMKQFGGSFAAAIGEAWMRADGSNQTRLEAAFPELFEKYSADQWRRA